MVKSFCICLFRIITLFSCSNGIEKRAEYYPDGKIKSIRYYKAGVLEGNSEDYDSLGNIKAKAFFWKGKAVGPITYYDNNSRNYIMKGILRARYTM